MRGRGALEHDQAYPGYGRRALQRVPLRRLVGSAGQLARDRHGRARLGATCVHVCQYSTYDRRIGVQVPLRGSNCRYYPSYKRVALRGRRGCQAVVGTAASSRKLVRTHRQYVRYSTRCVMNCAVPGVGASSEHSKNSNNNKNDFKKKSSKNKNSSDHFWCDVSVLAGGYGT